MKKILSILCLIVLVLGTINMAYASTPDEEEVVEEVIKTTKRKKVKGNVKEVSTKSEIKKSTPSQIKIATPIEIVKLPTPTKIITGPGDLIEDNPIQKTSRIIPVNPNKNQQQIALPPVNNIPNPVTVINDETNEIIKMPDGGLLPDGFTVGLSRLAVVLSKNKNAKCQYKFLQQLSENSYLVQIISDDSWRNHKWQIDIYPDDKQYEKTMNGYSSWFGYYDNLKKRIGTAQAKRILD